MSLKKLFYYIYYGFNCFILKKDRPLIAGISVSDDCNLKCTHCVVHTNNFGQSSYETITTWIDRFYLQGARILYLQGGEPLMWKEDKKDINHIMEYAKELGYFNTAIVTNGTMPFNHVQADYIWISLDGTKEVHNGIRNQEIFDTMMENIDNSTAKQIYTNMTVNTKNQHDVENLVKFVASKKKIKGISINFHTPYPGVEDLMLPLEERAKVIDRIIALKNEGYPIINSSSALEALKYNNYKKPIDMIAMLHYNQVWKCCPNDDPKICEQCGYAVIAEIATVGTLNPTAIWKALSFFR